MKSKLLAIFFIAIMTISLVGCGDKKSDNKSEGIKIYVGGTIFESSLDPIKGGMSYGYSFINSALTKVNPDSKYVGDMAKSWTVSNDALTYTFKLRDDVKFHDGSDFTAEDVVFTYNKVKENQGNNENVDLSKLNAVKAKDDYTVEFQLSEPYSSFLDQTALLGIVPSDSYDGKTFDKKPIGTGPWEIKEYDPQQKIIVEAYKDYYEGKPAIPQVTMLNISSETAISNAKSKELDLAMVESTYAGEEIKDMHIEDLKTIDVRQISLPVTKEMDFKTKEGKTIKVGNDVTADKAVRTALAKGIDREKIIKEALNGIGKPALGFSNKLSWGKEISYKDNEKAEAEKIMEAAGWKKNKENIYEKNGKLCEFNVLTATGDTERYQLTTAVAEEAKNIGIKINAKQKSWDEITKLAPTNGVLWGWGQFDPIVLKNLFYSKDFTGIDYTNTIKYSNPKVDKLIEQAISANNKKDADAYWKQVQTATEEDYAYLYVVNIEHSYFIEDSLDVSLETQILHPHGHGAPIINNMKDWTIK